MRPLRLHVEGFTSFRQPQDIDFSDLDLFVITGPTGSGKTSILDAITLALYGLVPRANKMELKELISLGASQAKVQLDFEVGRSTYRVARRLPRKGAQSATVERLDDGAAVPEVEGSGVKEANDRIVEIVGLDYDAFTRAVLLPQGAFSEFLKGDVAQRRRILVRLLDLERFEAAKRWAGERAKELEHSVASTTDLLQREYGDVTEDAVKAAAEAAKEATEAAEKLDGVLKVARQHAKERESIVRRRGSLQKLSSSLEDQTKELESLAESSRALEERDTKTKAALEESEASRERAEKERLRIRNEWESTLQETGDEAALASLEAAAVTLDECERRIRQLTDTIEAESSEQQKLSTQRSEVENLVKAAEAEQREAEEERESAVAALNAAREQRQQAKQAAALREDLEKKQETLESLKRDLARKEPAAAVARQELETAKADLQRIESNQTAAALRTHLHVGDDCPVCGSEIAAFPESEPATEAQITAARAARLKAEGAAREAENLVSGLKATITSAEGAVEELSARLNGMGEVLALADAEKFEVESGQAEQRAREKLEGAAEATKRVDQQKGELDLQLAKLEVKLSTDRQALAEQRDQAAGAEVRLVEGLGEPLPDRPREIIGDRRELLRGATSARDTAEKGYEEAVKAFEDVSSARRGIERELSDRQASLGTHRVLLEERRERLLEIEPVEAPQLEVVEEGLTAIPGLCGYSRTLCATTSEVDARCREELAEIDEAITDLISDAAIEYDGSDATAAASALEGAAQQRLRHSDRCTEQVRALKEKLGRKQKMVEELDEKRDRMGLYKKVASELQADRFITFLLNESFHDLALRASSELKMISGGRYSLGADGDGFVVVDHANADERRSVVTLSGGETFLASLALALALAQGIADIAGHSAAARLEAMFIDEGFGTLDPTALDLAVEALERLREGERMVGVITHVPALAERIPSGIAVEQRGGGSVVEMR